MVLKNENDIFIFFETIEQLEPKRILDIGMFLKRVGSVSRKTMDREVPWHVRLDGVDFFPEINFPVWGQIYDTIEGRESFLKRRITDRYDLVVLLGTDDLIQKPFFYQVTGRIPECSRFLLVDRGLSIWKEEWIKARIIDLQVEKDYYFLLDFKV